MRTHTHNHTHMLASNGAFLPFFIISKIFAWIDRYFTIRVIQLVCPISMLYSSYHVNCKLILIIKFVVFSFPSNFFLLRLIPVYMVRYNYLFKGILCKPKVLKISQNNKSCIGSSPNYKATKTVNFRFVVPSLYPWL